MMAAAIGETYPAAGVIVARPATDQVSKPTEVGRFSCHQPTIIQVMPANDAATSVFRNATAVTASTRNSLPALKPYQPNQRRPVPSATSGTLCAPESITRRLPT